MGRGGNRSLGGRGGGKRYGYARNGESSNQGFNRGQQSTNFLDEDKSGNAFNSSRSFGSNFANNNDASQIPAVPQEFDGYTILGFLSCYLILL